MFSLLSVTLGWSNGLIPSSRPANAVGVLPGEELRAERAVDRDVRVDAAARHRARAERAAAA